MSRRKRIGLGVIAGWQILSLAVMGVAFWQEVLQTRYPNMETANGVVRSLLQPSAEDLWNSVAEVKSAQPDWPEGREDIDVDRLDDVLRRLREGEYSRVYYAKNRETEISAPESLKRIAWRTWNESGEPSDRARSALVLAAYIDDEAHKFLFLKAALRHATYKSTLSKEEWLPLLSEVARLAYAHDDPLLAYALWTREETELGFRAVSENLGPAVFNQGVALQKAGFPATAELVFLRLFSSAVNDQDAGTDLMTAARNYRNNAARLIAESYSDRRLYVHAMFWHYRALHEFEFRSWCGTCNRIANGSIRRGILKDAALAGPLFLGAVLLSNPLEFGLHWIAILLASIVFWLRWRSRRSDPTAAVTDLDQV